MSGKRGATRLGFAVLLKFYTQHGRFPRGRFELPGEAVEFVARQVQVPASELDAYEWSGRTAEYHRAQIRGHLGFRECSVADADKLTGWLAEHVACKERRSEQVRVQLLARCRAECIEPPTPGRCDRIVGAVLRVAEETLTARISARITAESIANEVVAFQALRDQLKCKEIWVGGADKWRNPDEDLPQDFAERREENYSELREPLDAAVFVDELREQMTTELTLLNDRMPKLSWLDVAEWKSGAIRLAPAEAQPEPRNLRRIENEVQRRWGVVPLIDLLKEAVLRTGCLDAVTSVSGGGSLSAEVLAERLLLDRVHRGDPAALHPQRLPPQPTRPCWRSAAPRRPSS